MAINHQIRTNGKKGVKDVRLTPLKAIKFNCIECMGFQAKLVQDCSNPFCPLYPFRLGRAPRRQR